MSIGCMIQVFYNSQASGNDRLILLAIADEADDEGRNAFPSVRRLAEKANCHTDTVIECVKRLEVLGELEVIRPEKQGRGRFNKYRVLLGNVGNSDHSDSGLVEGSVEGSARVDPRQNSAQSAPKYKSTRAIVDKSPSSYPHSEPRRHDCELCDQGFIEETDGSVKRCSNWT